MTSSAVKPQAATTQVYSIFIRATPEQVWEAITTPEFTRRYFHGSEIDSTLTEQIQARAQGIEHGPPRSAALARKG
jgi:uncharacterized protein YndB with AHSA1/START domain